MDWIPPPTRQRRDFECPEEDKDGASLSSHGSVSNTNIGPNGSSSGETILTCDYRDGAGECSYFQDGTFSSGSSACPDGSAPPSTPNSTTQTVTQTQSSVVTQTTSPPTSTFPSPPLSSFITQTASPPISTFSSPPSSSSISQTTAFQNSSVPLTSSSSAALESQSSPPVQSGSTARTALSAGSIGGITIGAIGLWVLGLVLVFCIRRTRRSRRDDLEADITAYPSNPAAPSEPGSTAAQSRQEYLATQLSAVQKQLEALQSRVGDGSTHLEEATQQNAALRARIRILEREMDSQGVQGLTDSPPGYLD
ncbi:hypothetical protein B0H16DRAFT_323925 [Mycena metata]|uniref:Uncharacterized protein n=1 Tax=Mycena metata TaxID=1033252 RepID=A0AAD7MMV6_9AGAR|nr:hypothetical protein B0H16DRAFT_323925 [Mycena metata]